MNKTIGLILGVFVFLLFGRLNAMSYDSYYIGTCILICGFMIGDERRNNK